MRRTPQDVPVEIDDDDSNRDSKYDVDASLLVDAMARLARLYRPDAEVITSQPKRHSTIAAPLEPLLDQMTSVTLVLSDAGHRGPLHISAKVEVTDLDPQVVFEWTCPAWSVASPGTEADVAEETDLRSLGCEATDNIRDGTLSLRLRIPMLSSSSESRAATVPGKERATLRRAATFLYSH